MAVPWGHHAGLPLSLPLLIHQLHDPHAPKMEDGCHKGEDVSLHVGAEAQLSEGIQGLRELIAVVNVFDLGATTSRGVGEVFCNV